MRHKTRLLSSVGSALAALAVLQLTGCSSPEERAQNYYEHGKQLLAAHDEKRAEVEFRNAIKYNRKLLPAWQSLAQVADLTHNWGAEAAALRGVIELDPDDVGSRVKLGRLLMIGGAFDEALKLVDEVKEPDKQTADLLSLKAAILFKLNDSAGAIREAHEALKRDPANMGALFVIAGDDFARGDAKEALAVLDRVPASGKSAPEIGVELFKLRIFEQTQNLPQAEALLQKLIEVYPKEVSFKKELIRLYLFEHRNDDAEKAQRLIVATDPKDTQAQLDLVRLLNTTQGPAAATQQLESLIKAGGDVFPYQIALAEEGFAQGKYDDAVALLKRLIQDPSSAEHVVTAQLQLAQLYMSKRKTDEADALVSDVLHKDGRNIAGLKLRAAIEMQRGKLEDAVTALRQALNDQPRGVDLMLMLAIAYERSGSIELAEKEFADAMQVSGFNPTVSLNYVAFLERRGSVSHAEDVLTDLAGRWPKNVQVLTALAQNKLARQDWVGAQELAETIKRLSADHLAGDELLGAALAGRNKFEESITALQDAYTAAPTATQPMYALVRAYLRAQKPNEAIGFLESVLKADPANAQAMVLLGSVQILEKQPNKAKQNFESAIQKQPSNPIGYRALSDFYVLQKNYEEGLKVVRAGLKEQPDSSVLQLALANGLEQTGDYDGAIAEYEQILKKDAGSIIVANNLASLLSDHRTDKASLDKAAALAASLQKSPVPQFKDTLGWVSYRQGDYRGAVALLEQAAKAMPAVALVHYHLGMSYVATGQSAKATEQFNAALSQTPDKDLQGRIKAELAKLGTN